MDRYILRFTGAGRPPTENLRHVEGQPGIRLVDTSPRMLLVESSPSQADALARSLHQWSLSRETSTSLPPQPRPRLRTRR